MKLIAIMIFCDRDKHLVKDALKNISFVDEVMLHDDSKRTGEFNERDIRLSLKNRAIKAGADWILELDPDERFEKGAGEVIRELIKYKKKVMYKFNFRELYTPLKYRTDGVWAKKHRISLYPVYPRQKMKDKKVNVKTFPLGYRVIDTNLNLYHLKMIEPENREHRVNWLKEIDPENKTQTKGYDYLLDETNIKLETIPKGREYLPRYKRYSL